MTAHNLDVLVVTPDNFARRRLVSHLRAEGHRVTEAASGLAGVEQALQEACDIAVIDTSLPDIGFDQFVAMVGAVGSVLVIAAVTEGSVVDALDAGADDAADGFDPIELAARLRVAMRRIHRLRPPARRIEIGGLVIDVAGRSVTVNGTEVSLTRREFDLLAALAQRRGEVVSKRELLAEVWDQPYGGPDKTVDVHLSWLRSKLGESGSEPGYLRTVRGVGIKLVDPTSD